MPPAKRRRQVLGLRGTPSERLNEGIEDGLFKGNQLQIANALVGNWSRAAWAPAARICDVANVDKAAVSNFWKRLGYRNQEEFQKAARNVDESAEIRTFSRSSGSKLLKAIRNDQAASLSSIAALNDKDRHHLEDQVYFAARELSASSQILIVASTDIGNHYTAAIKHIFSSVVEQNVEVLETIAQLAKATKNDGVLVLNVCCDYDENQHSVPLDFQGRSFHLLAGPAELEPDSHLRVLRCHDGTDPYANVSILFQVASIIARRINEIQKNKA